MNSDYSSKSPSQSSSDSEDNTPKIYDERAVIEVRKPSFIAEYEDHCKNNTWAKYYHNLVQDALQNAQLKDTYTVTEARKPANRVLNRYRDVNPYDHTRVILVDSKVDYINASLVVVKQAKRKYILTQGPLPSTVSHFWLMVWQQKSAGIVMLNKVIERNEIKCHYYWPEKEGESESLLIPEYDLCITKLETEVCPEYTINTFNLVKSEPYESRKILHFHYTHWPDFGVPSSPKAFLQFLDKVRISDAMSPENGPVIVHCSAGIGRSGTFCLVDSCLEIIKRVGVFSLNIRNVLLEMRRHRVGLIQTSDQFRFSYQAIIEGLKYMQMQHYYKYITEEHTLSPVLSSLNCSDDDKPPCPPPRQTSLDDFVSRPLPPRPRLINDMTNTGKNLPSSDCEESVSPLSSSDDEADSDQSNEVPVHRSNVFSVRERKGAKVHDHTERMKENGPHADMWKIIKKSLFKWRILAFTTFFLGSIFFYYKL